MRPHSGIALYGVFEAWRARYRRFHASGRRDRGPGPGAVYSGPSTASLSAVSSLYGPSTAITRLSSQDGVRNSVSLFKSDHSETP